MVIGACGPVVMGSSAGQVKGAPDVLTKLTIPRVDEGAQLRLWAPRFCLVVRLGPEPGDVGLRSCVGRPALRLIGSASN